MKKIELTEGQKKHANITRVKKYFSTRTCISLLQKLHLILTYVGNKKNITQIV